MRRILNHSFGFILISTVSLMAAWVCEASELELPSEDKRWIKVETPNFTVFANTDPKIATGTARSLEQLWAVLVRHLDGVPAAAPVPTYVYVFDFFSDAYVPYGPFSKGKPEKSGGYFISRPQANYIAIVERDYRYPNHLDILHDFLHTVLDDYFPELPLWLEEGLADYYSVFHVEDGRAHVGYRINRHIAWLRNNPLIPLAELLAIDESSPEYAEEHRNGIFFAESWLLTHMLLNEHPDGRAQAELYAKLLREGVDRDTAFTKAFNTTYEKLEKELKKYVRTRSHHYTVFPLSGRIVQNTRVSAMARTEVLFRLGDLLGSGLMERVDFAAEHFNAVLALDDSFGPGVAGLGSLDEAAGRNEAALARYEQAAALSPDDYRSNLLLGRSLFGGLASAASDEARVAQLQRARTALRRATELRPDLVEAWIELGSTYLTDMENIDRGIDALEHAMELQPKRPGVGIDLTMLYVKQGSAAKADWVIARLKAAGVGEETLRRAKEIASQLEPGSK
jgi:tetratricopeptide (TPR) repeat protein